MKRESATKLKWMNSTILGIGLASLCSDVGHEMATTVMPALLASLGVGSAAEPPSLSVDCGAAEGIVVETNVNFDGWIAA